MTQRLPVLIPILGLLLAGCTEDNPGAADGTEGGACYPNGTCNAGLQCVSGACVAPTVDTDGAVAGDSGQWDAAQVGGDTTGVVPGGKFSFFVTSLAALQKLSGSQDGFGGDLRHGETGPGAGLRGADKICAAIAEMSMPGAAARNWRAFLSVTADENGKQVNAIDRIGNGPWYDRLGRLLAPTKADLLNNRPQNGDTAIQNDLPNEDGVPNHQPDPTQPQVDNHHMLTGSRTDGTLYGAFATCKDWTTSDGSYANGRPQCGMAWPRNMGGGGFPQPAPGGGKPGGGGDSNWISAITAPGCAPGVDIGSFGGAPPGSDSVGAGGGYGGFYCFALVP